MEERYDIPSSSSFVNHNGVPKPNIENLNFVHSNQAEEFMEDFDNPSNLIRFKKLVEDFEIKLPERILIKALKLLGDASYFEYHSENIIPHLEIHLRTWMATLER
ncbi:1739_t:CDS:1, partial [Scutellospora calospora]